MAVCKSYGLMCVSRNKQRRDLANQIVRRILNRTSTNVQQAGDFTMNNFPLELIEEVLGPSTRTTKRCHHWRLDEMDEISNKLGPIMAESGISTRGSTRAMKLPSSLKVNVVGTIIFFECCHRTFNVDSLTCSFLYTLMDESGTMHKPKDEFRRELPMSAFKETQIRAQISWDASAMATQQPIVPLSAAWLYQLGLTSQGNIARAQEMNHFASGSASLFSPPAGTSQAGTFKRPRRQSQQYPVAQILDSEFRGYLEYFLVEWDHSQYHASWEEWRMEGDGVPGDPVRTWEPKSQSLLNTEAYRRWCARPTPPMMRHSVSGGGRVSGSERLGGAPHVGFGLGVL